MELSEVFHELSEKNYLVKQPSEENNLIYEHEATRLTKCLMQLKTEWVRPIPKI